MFNLKYLAHLYQFIIVDIDNTLINYTYSHNRALMKTLSIFNFLFEDYEMAKIQIKKRNLSANHHKKELYFKIMCENNNIHFSQAKNMFDVYTNEFLKHIKIDKTMFNLISYAKSINKTILVITNFYFIEQINKLKSANLLSMIDFLICSEEFEKEKPNKLLLDRAFKLANIVKKDEVVVIGDSIVDNMGIYGIDYYPYNCSKFLMSISGKSGSGKSTISKAISSIIDCNIISADGYHKYDRQSKMWDKITHYNPNANNLIQLALDIKHIYQDIGNVSIPIYNHDSGKFSKALSLATEDLNFVIIEGLHTLYKEVVGDFVKVKLYIDSDESDNQKIQRDINKRGYDLKQAIDVIEKRESDYKKYLFSQKENANFLIEVRNGRFTISLTGILKDIGLEEVYCGNYDELIPTVKQIILKIINNRWI